jgi:transcriptional regulator with XRE-family HTH domain
MVKKAAQAQPNHLLRRARQERGWSQRMVADRISSARSACTGAPATGMGSQDERRWSHRTPAGGAADWAARLWGAAEALRETFRFIMPPVERSTYEQAVTAVRSELGEEAFAASWQAGRTTPLEQVIHDVLKMRGEAEKQ